MPNQQTTIEIKNGQVSVMTEGKVDIEAVGGVGVHAPANTPSNEGLGPWCSLPACLYSGAPHTCARTGPCTQYSPATPKGL